MLKCAEKINVLDYKLLSYNLPVVVTVVVCLTVVGTPVVSLIDSSSKQEKKIIKHINHTHKQFL